MDPDRLSVLGFSIGGRYAMMLATEPHGLRAAVAFYARPWPGGAIADVALAPGNHVAGFGVPVCAVFGEEDELVPLEMVARFKGLMDAQIGHGHAGEPGCGGSGRRWWRLCVAPFGGYRRA